MKNTVETLVRTLSTLPQGCTFRICNKYMQAYDTEGMMVAEFVTTPEGELIAEWFTDKLYHD